ncbi:LacI family DNA-binding transcriptional regulator [Cohnella sp. 56]|uniref:LacI family DNA-binding transcriptional regulator n=1 Tax=Cohnella sp. 56 TaxID=3113722 RepID=UPI0030E7DD05
MRNKVTIQQIADLAGLSKFAVSRALAGKPGVSPQTRDLIIKTAGQLGYFHEASSAPVARTDRNESMTAGAVAILFPNIRYQNQENEYWGSIFSSIVQRLEELSLDVLTLTQPARDNLSNILNPEGILGVITVGTVSTQVLLDIRQLGIPIVMIDHSDPAIPCDSLFADNQAGIHELMTILISKGYRSFQFFGPTSFSRSFYERWQSYRSALESFRVPYRQDEKLITTEGEELHAHVQQLVRDSQLPEVFVCANDWEAMMLTEWLRAEGKAVPDDCAVTGFDDSPDAAAMTPGLTTVRVSKELLGSRAVDQLIWRASNRGSNPERKLIAGEVVIRDSIGKK